MLWPRPAHAGGGTFLLCFSSATAAQPRTVIELHQPATAGAVSSGGGGAAAAAAADCRPAPIGVGPVQPLPAAEAVGLPGSAWVGRRLEQQQENQNPEKQAGRRRSAAGHGGGGDSWQQLWLEVPWRRTTGLLPPARGQRIRLAHRSAAAAAAAAAPSAPSPTLPSHSPMSGHALPARNS